jgi:hypothetical protein
MTTKTEAKHTEEEWKVQSVFVNNAPNQWHVSTGKWGAGSIAVCDTEDHARLIAAAPDLLDAAKGALKFVTNLKGCDLPMTLDPESCSIGHFADYHTETLSEAIAKAEGR